jgi:hypothetical protein
MHCPECGAEYREGFTECAGCGVALVAALPSAPPDDLVCVFESSDRFAIDFAKGCLEEAQIPYWMLGDETAARLVLSPILFPLCRFLVPVDQENEARQLLSTLTPGAE